MKSFSQEQDTKMLEYMFKKQRHIGTCGIGRVEYFVQWYDKGILHCQEKEYKTPREAIAALMETEDEK